jgi:hypothetical protein
MTVLLLILNAMSRQKRDLAEMDSIREPRRPWDGNQPSFPSFRDIDRGDATSSLELTKTLGDPLSSKPQLILYSTRNRELNSSGDSERHERLHSAEHRCTVARPMVL